VQSDSGLQLNWHRWYDTRTGQWTTEDPVRFEAGDASLTRYVRNNPLNGTDPTGLFDPRDVWKELESNFQADWKSLSQPGPDKYQGWELVTADFSDGSPRAWRSDFDTGDDIEIDVFDSPWAARKKAGTGDSVTNNWAVDFTHKLMYIDAIRDETAAGFVRKALAAIRNQQAKEIAASATAKASAVYDRDYQAGKKLRESGVTTEVVQGVGLLGDGGGVGGAALVLGTAPGQSVSGNFASLPQAGLTDGLAGAPSRAGTIEGRLLLAQIDQNAQVKVLGEVKATQWQDALRAINAARTEGSETNKLWAWIGLAGSVLETGAGVVTLATTGWTGAGAVGGTFLTAHGIDSLQANWRSIATGKHQRSYFNEGVRSQFIGIGVDKRLSEILAALTEVGATMGAGAMSSAGRVGALGRLGEAGGAAVKITAELGGTVRAFVQGVVITTADLAILAESGIALAAAGELLANGPTILAVFNENTGGGGGNAPRGRGRFASEDLLREHQGRHGPELGCRTPASYERQAGDFLLGPRGPNVLERVRADGTIVRFDQVTNEFGVISANGTVRSYYIPKPNAAGAGGHNYPTNLDYFNAQ
jgi:RHS repeat-associated protein